MARSLIGSSLKLGMIPFCEKMNVTYRSLSPRTHLDPAGWGTSVFLQETVTTSDYWIEEEKILDISRREALALDRALASFPNLLRNAWMEAHVDNRAVVDAWSRQGGRIVSLNRMIKRLFFTSH